MVSLGDPVIRAPFVLRTFPPGGNRIVLRTFPPGATWAEIEHFPRSRRPLQNLRHSGESRNPEGWCKGDTRAFGPDSHFQTRGSGSKPPLIPPWSSRGRVGRGPSVIKGEGWAWPLGHQGEGFCNGLAWSSSDSGPLCPSDISPASGGNRIVLRTFPPWGQPDSFAKVVGAQSLSLPPPLTARCRCRRCSRPRLRRRWTLGRWGEGCRSG